jgi:2-polyprenyl-6-methoxyphenol hydroxylase-like FAD-dependent oxidoreductase
VKKVPVLIVGSGPVGLGLAADLGWRGIECLLVEQHDGTITHPRATSINSRSMEFCRRWGIADKVREAGTPPDYPATIVYCTTLQGKEIARIERRAQGGRAVLAHTPEPIQRCNQIWFDPILRELALSFPTVSLRYRTKFEDYETKGDGVVCTIRNLETGEAETIEAQYLVACCGGGSVVPKRIAGRLKGVSVLSYHLNIFLKIPLLWEHHDKGKAGFYYFVDVEANHPNLVELDGREFWRLAFNNETKRLTRDDIDIDAMVEKFLGPNLNHEILSVTPWTCRGLVAEKWAEGPVFIAGDSAHQHGPTGGFGMNTGMGDATNISWKLAAMIEGWGGPNLLPSYEIERQPVAQVSVDEATDNMINNRFDFVDEEDLRHVGDDGPEADAIRKDFSEKLLAKKSKQFLSEGIALGYRYDTSPVTVSDGTPVPEGSISKYVQNARPGSRAPHAIMADGRSTIDLFGRGFVLLRFRGAKEETLAKAAAARGVPFEAIDIDDKKIAELYDGRLVLVRPDGHVSWRGNDAPIDALAVIDQVRGA